MSLRRFQNCNTLIINHFRSYGVGFVSFDDEVEQYLCAAVLRPGNVPASACAVGILRPLQYARVLAGITEQSDQVYWEVNYAAGSWERVRRVIFKAEVVCGEGKEPKENPRFVITNMNQTPQWLYEDVYCQCGDIENRIQKLHALEIDRTS
jgi:hypothetical protein